MRYAGRGANNERCERATSGVPSTVVRKSKVEDEELQQEYGPEEKEKALTDA
ncbi:hypothetical protein HGRIS_003248 [Hohenbuehelia grisea]|uniref:Uncharacterized protein n=1 Tax=Hohenbuehelia grisea TaxID=104357 RepID=A0ABR3JNM4_9AGAR